MKTDLLVIDVQDYFDTSKPIVDETIREIKLAKRRGAAVVIVKFKGCGDTNKRVLDAAKGYDRTIFVSKQQDGGGREVVNVCSANKLKPKKFRVVGVNRSFCVMETVYQLFDILPKLKIQVSENGTNCNTWSRSEGLAGLAKLGCDII